jgi:hypothetical protein
VISHHHRVIFIHIPKTGGQSIEQVFLDDLGLTWDERAALTLRENDDERIGPRRLAHLYADEYVELGHVTEEQWNTYFKFAVVRNPYDRIVSEYLYRFQKTPFWRKPSAKSFVERRHPSDFPDVARHMQTQLRYVSDDDGKIIVDRIIKFEDLANEFGSLTERIFGESRGLPHRNRTTTSDKRTKERILDRIRPLVADIYREDFEAFGYPR